MKLRVKHAMRKHTPNYKTLNISIKTWERLAELKRVTGYSANVITEFAIEEFQKNLVIEN